MFKTLKPKTILLSFLFLLLLSTSNLFSATKSITLINGYDKQNSTISFVGSSRNVSQATINSIEGLESEIEKEIQDRCQKIYKNYSDTNSSTLDFFLRGMAANMDDIKRSMIRRSRCRQSYLSDRGEVVVYYSLSCDAFEEVFEEYIDKFDVAEDELSSYVKEIKSINRFFKYKYSNSENKVLRVEA